jgi:hypothetical protein
MQQVVLCSSWCASPGQPRVHHLKRKDQAGHVEYWKAQCGESRMLRLGGGKGRKLLPIRTEGWYQRALVAQRAYVAYCELRRRVTYATANITT